ncbi:hypothetical protein [Agromyces laixinhei]|uniref:hypothetical protein n=1 Tax=Agromyces laixinhei TaxID=2585717 RepID=UPI0011175FA8|nr:hypothetical protein [Agromyces laixinhei]
MSILPTRVISRPTRIGVIADGWFKLTLAAAYAIFIAPLSTWLDAPMWLTGLTAAAIAGAGAAELATYRVRARRHVLLLAGYDAVWLLASVGSYLMALAEFSAAGSTWLAVQAIASALLTALFITGTSALPHSSAHRTRK